MSDFLTTLNAHTVREEARLDRIGDELAAVRDILTAQQVILQEHIKRSERLESLVDIGRDQMAALHEEHAVAVQAASDTRALIANLSTIVTPLVESRRGWEMAGKLLTVGAGLAASIAGVLKFLGVL